MFNCPVLFYVYLEQLAHDFSSGATKGLGKVIKVLEIGLVERVPDDLDVHLVQVFGREAVAKVRRKGGLDQDRVVELCNVGRHTEGRHTLKDAQRVTPLQQLMCVAFVQCSRDQQDDIVDHVRISNDIISTGTRGEERERRVSPVYSL